MKVLVFTSDDAPEMRNAKDLAARLAEEGYEIEYLDPENPDCSAKQELYEVTSYPSFVIVTDDGSMIQQWSGRIPLEYDIKMFLSA